MIGGIAIDRMQVVQLVYASIGVLTFLIPLYVRLFRPRGKAELHLRIAPG